jgi:uncharacterized protein (DUF2236 family)
MSQFAFGHADAVHQAARQVNRCHQHVQGQLLYDAGSWHAGTHYDANDPSLRLWVLATLIDSSLVAFERFVRPLSASDCEGYIRDAGVIAALLGIPSELFPATYAQFRDYCDEMIQGDALQVADTARNIAHALFHGAPISPLIRLGSYAGIGLLPERIRSAYGLRWTPSDEARLNRSAAFFQRARRALPDALCVHPRAWLTERRVRDQAHVGHLPAE